MSDLIIYNTPDGKSSIALYAKDGSVWLNQTQIAELFATSKQNIGQHVSSILKESELDADSVVKNYFTTAADGKNYNVTFYSLEMIMAIGFRVRGVRGTQFRQWANRNLTEYLRKGFVMDDERLKNPDGRPDYFDELLSRIRDIRASEKRFHAVGHAVQARCHRQGNSNVFCRNPKQIAVCRYRQNGSRIDCEPCRCTKRKHGFNIVERGNCSQAGYYHRQKLPYRR